MTGIYQILSNVVTAITSALQNLPVDSVPGDVSVKPKKYFGDCSCHIPGEAASVPLASIVVPLLFVAARQFTGRSRRPRR